MPFQGADINMHLLTQGVASLALGYNELPLRGVLRRWHWRGINSVFFVCSVVIKFHQPPTNCSHKKNKQLCGERTIMAAYIGGRTAIGQLHFNRALYPLQKIVFADSFEIGVGI